MDFLSLSKILPLLVLPFNVALWLMITALILLSIRRNVGAGICLGIAMAVLVLAGNPTLSSSLYTRLEQTYLPVPVADSPAADAIVVLGGGLGLPIRPRLSADLNSAADRLLHTKRLYLAGKAPLVVITGGHVFPQPGVRPESFYASELLQEWGVPESAILIEHKSRNTYENAKYTSELLASKGIGKVLLVTSATHMPRAHAVFLSNGIDAIPCPTDYNMVELNQPALLNFIPNLGAISATTSVVSEYLGILAYRYKGWITDEAT